ncbi:MAG: PepSY domain-containing protein [Marinomonas sp.]
MMIKALTFGTAMALGVAGLAFTSFGSTAAHAQTQVRSTLQAETDQGKARQEMRAGNVMSLRKIERRILPKMKGSEYLGPSYDSAARAYRLKFIKSGRVTYIDVDATSGKIIKRSR